MAALGIVVAAPPASALGSPASQHVRPSSGPFGWLRPAPAPLGWNRVVIPSGEASLAYPPSFAPIPGDPGTVSAAVRSSVGVYRAYLNVTPRQGDERLRGFARLREHLLGEEHDESVHEEAAAEGLAFGSGRGSCVLDDYLTRIGHHHYREIACFVTGHRGRAVVVVGAATTSEWAHFPPLLRRSVASLQVA